VAENATKEEAEAVAESMMRHILRMSVPPPSQAPSPEVREFVDTHLREGRPICEFLWLPTSYQPAFLACLKDEGGYGSAFGPLGLWLRFRNVSPRPLRVVRDLRSVSKKIAQQRGDTIAYVQGDTWRDVETVVMVPPGETVDLPARWAINALLQHCQTGWTPNQWGESSAIPDTKALEQLGLWTATGVDTRAPDRVARKVAQREGTVAPG
jgi:hypothetical protein